MCQLSVLTLLITSQSLTPLNPLQSAHNIRPHWLQTPVNTSVGGRGISINLTIMELNKLLLEQCCDGLRYRCSFVYVALFDVSYRAESFILGE